MTTTSVSESVERRLDRIELAVQSLTSSVNQVLDTVKSARTATYPRGDAHYATSRSGVKEPQLFIGPSHSFSIVRDALSNVEGLGSSSTSITEHQNAREGLNDLSTAIATAAVDAQEPEEADSAMGFYVPTKQAGYGFISRKNAKYYYVFNRSLTKSLQGFCKTLSPEKRYSLFHQMMSWCRWYFIQTRSLRWPGSCSSTTPCSPLCPPSLPKLITCGYSDGTHTWH